MGLQVAGGNPVLPDIGARAYNSGNISVNNTTWTALTFDSERWDTDGIHSVAANTSRLTCQTAGKYLIVGQARFASNAGGDARVLRIRINATTKIAAVAFSDLNGNFNADCVLGTVYDLGVGDYVEVEAYQDSGGALNITADPASSPEFSMQLIAEA
jgi:hypothetical protein